MPPKNHNYIFRVQKNLALPHRHTAQRRNCMAEKNILVNRGIPPQDQANHHRGVPAGYGLPSRSNFLDQNLDASEEIAAYLQNLWAEEALAAEREQQASAIIAAEIARRDREAANRQGEHELMLRQAESAARAAAEQHALALSNQAARDHAKEAARLQSQKLAEEARLAAQVAEDERRRRDEENYARHASDAGRLWSSLAGPYVPTQGLPQAWENASDAGKHIFVRSAAAMLARQLSILAALYPSELDPGELAPLIYTTPASELGVTTNDLALIANSNGSVEVSHRLVPGIDGRLTWLKVDDISIGANVRVRTVIYDPIANLYHFTRDGESTPTLTWTPNTPNLDSSTSLPIAPQFGSIYSGTELKPKHLDPYFQPGHTWEPDDYIIRLPIDLGSKELYIYFKNPRDLPGVASGSGQMVDGTWLGERTQSEGVPIPSSVADQLRGMKFPNFDKFREELWKAVSNDASLVSQLSSANQLQVKRGKAPYPKKSDQAGGRDKFEIHHVEEISKGGAVYEIDNMVIMTPKQHIHHHSGKQNDIQR
jgi:hypothetical protein